MASPLASVGENMAELIGKTLAKRYRVDESVGRGGMAEVYKVWDTRRSTFLAMKLLHADLALDRVFLRRFKREAQTLAHLQHPNIVRFYGMEQDDRLVFMLMDYIEGESLKVKIFDANGPMPPEQIIAIMRSVCQALHYAHSEGYVHADVKPGNILIDKTGRVMLSDFGVARMTETATATMVGAGTPAYMAPEQTRGENPTPQSDIYSLAIVLFEMLTGERPFTGEHAKTGGSTGEKVHWEQENLKPPSPRKFNPQLSTELEAVVLKALEKNPRQRFESALSSFAGARDGHAQASPASIAKTDLAIRDCQSRKTERSHSFKDTRFGVSSKTSFLGLGRCHCDCDCCSFVPVTEIGALQRCYFSNIHA